MCSFIGSCFGQLEKWSGREISMGLDQNINSFIYFYSDVKLWLSFRIYADSTFNSTYEEYKQPKHIQKRICRNLRNYIKTHHGPLLPSEVAQLFLSCQNENRNGLKSCRPQRLPREGQGLTNQLVQSDGGLRVSQKRNETVNLLKATRKCICSIKNIN